MTRQPYPPPQHLDKSAVASWPPKQIALLHPGYAGDAQLFLILPACDENDTIDHELARIACAVVACNAFDGFLTTDAGGVCRVNGAQLPFIDEGYFFHVPDRDGTSKNSSAPTELTVHRY